MSGHGTPHKPFDTRAPDYRDQLSRGLRLSGESKEYFARSRLAHLRAFWAAGGRPEPATVIDYGCGVGDVTVLLAEAFPGARVLGVDPSKPFVEQARSTLRSDRVDFLQLEGYAPIAAEPACLVHLNGVVHHVPPAERPDFFRALHACVAPGGVVALFDNNPWNPGTHLVMRRIPFDRDVLPVPAGRVVRHLEAAGLHLLSRRFLFYFPAALRILRPLERRLEMLPFGAQYALYAQRRAGGARGPADA